MKFEELKVGQVIAWCADGRDHADLHQYRVLAIDNERKTATLNLIKLPKYTMKLGTTLKWSYFSGASVLQQPETSTETIIAPRRKTNYKKSRQPLYIATTKGGLTHKGIANVLNAQKRLDHFGNSPTHALSNWENKHGKKMDIDNGIVWKLVPYQIRKDTNGRFRIGREIK